MIELDSKERNSNWLRILTEDQISDIKRAVFQVMSTTGFKVLHEGARRMMKKAGALVQDERVKVPEHIVIESVTRNWLGV